MLLVILMCVTLFAASLVCLIMPGKCMVRGLKTREPVQASSYKAAFFFFTSVTLILVMNFKMPTIVGILKFMTSTKGIVI